MKTIIANRYLKYSDENSETRRDLTIKISAPFKVDKSEQTFESEHLCFCCIIYAVNEMGQVSEERVHGADEVQAVHLASDFDSLIKRMSKKLEIYWPTGERYFEE